MKFNAILMITAASAVLSAPVPDDVKPPPTGVPADAVTPADVGAYANYGDYNYKQYASYGQYGQPTPTPPPPPPPPGYGAYATYGTYKRVAEWLKAKLE